MLWCLTKSQLVTFRLEPLDCEILTSPQGVVMATRVFDTYVAGADEMMVVFLNSISEQRILCFGIMVSVHIMGLNIVRLLLTLFKDEGTFSLKENGRNSLKALGSRLSGTCALFRNFI